ncbi:MAG TPA: hypothetical protein VLE27_13330, partial [Thermoanaerobaculia bacterium]|nr:hypothetical protein [Thermoanaerobaculia bacterium]
IQTYEPGLREASIQSFGIDSAGGVLYIANGAGVLVFDGAWWRLIEIGQGKTAFVVASDSAGRVAVGGVDEIGTLEPDAGGTLRYVSLIPHLPPAQRRYGQTLDVAATADGFAFLTDRWLAVWDGSSFTTVASYPGDRPYTDLFPLERENYVWERDRGLLRLAGTKLEPVPGGEGFRGRRVDLLLPADGGLLVSVRGEGLFLLSGGVATPFAPEATRWALTARIVEGIRLPDGRWALGSVLGGLLLLRPDGGVDQVIDTTAGLTDDYVTGMAVDREGSLWLSLNSGLDRLEVASPLSVLDRRSGLQGSVYHMTRHRGDLWAATAAGVFTIDPGEPSGAAPPERPRTGRMRPVPGIPPAGWWLLSAGDDLLAATAAGVYRIRDGRPRMIEGTDQNTAYTLEASRSDPDRVWVGASQGLYALRRDGPEWRIEGGIEGLEEDEVRSIVEGEGGVLWCGTSLHGVIRVEVPAGWPARRADVRRVPGDGAVNVFRIADRILATHEKQVLRLDEARGVLVDDPALASLAGHGQPYGLAEDAQGNLWMNTAPLSVGLRRGSGWPALRSLVEVPARSVETIFAEPDGTVWLAGDDGLYRYDGLSRSPGPPLPAPRLASVTTGAGRLFGGAPGTAPPSAELSADVRRLRIEFAPLSFRAGLRYQTRLDPEDADWNPPSPEP